MQSLLNDIELDIQDLKCLMQAIAGDANPALRIVAKRNIQQMRMRLDALQGLLDDVTIVKSEPILKETVKLESEPLAISTVSQNQSAVTTSSSILAERIKPSANLRQSISLNDSFRFARELFDGDSSRMNDIVGRLGDASSFDKALDIFTKEVHPDEENTAAADFVELLKKYFS